MASETYRIEFRPAAFRDFEKLDKSIQRRLGRKIESLATNPRPSGVKKLAGEYALWRVRVGDYRIVYGIEDDCLVVLVIRVAHRREVYR
ncbi:MAG: plasmid stabilization protein [Deltaproteobacteria bacterium RIFOXYA12_FULL_58_15]|nr:MAG: plasmid stabilization protein [Deltaproteobacteria bacterium RIFOXYA12_FULL_58_15]OGR15010.1 MAG: plasmid stabilization protein [Deltaproteobacteria bacterium RIFOXYB12_FULL_58_9]